MSFGMKPPSKVDTGLTKMEEQKVRDVCFECNQKNPHPQYRAGIRSELVYIQEETSRIVRSFGPFPSTEAANYFLDRLIKFAESYMLRRHHPHPVKREDWVQEG